MAAPPEIPTFYVQPALPYNYSAQEPYIDFRTNTIHWDKHVAAYFANLNNAAAKNVSLQVSILCTLFLLHIITMALACLSQELHQRLPTTPMFEANHAASLQHLMPARPAILA